MQFETDHFVVRPGSAPALFARSVNRIEIEIASFCNRTCSYCPNSFIDRRSSRQYMDDALFSGILDQLAGIGWNGELTFHRYNEPLADRDYLIRRLREARRMLPEARLTLFTNGDYLDRDYLHEIYVAGCRHIHATFHVEPSQYDDAGAAALLAKRLALLQYPYTINPVSRGVLAMIAVAPDLEFSYQINDFARVVDGDPVRKDRGQALAPNAALRRTAACVIPFSELQVEVDGTLMPCCHLRSDVPSHRGYALGRLTPGDDLFAAWSNAGFVTWRRSLATKGPRSCLVQPAPTVSRGPADVQGGWDRCCAHHSARSRGCMPLRAGTASRRRRDG